MSEERRCAYWLCRGPFNATKDKENYQKFCCNECRQRSYRERAKESLNEPLALAAEAIAKWCKWNKRDLPGIEDCTRLRDHIADAIQTYYEAKTGQAGEGGGSEA